MDGAGEQIHGQAISHSPKLMCAMAYQLVIKRNEENKRFPLVMYSHNSESL